MYGKQEALEQHRQANYELSKKATRLYPDSPGLQAEWIRAVGVVRSTKIGWLLDTPITHHKEI